ncbi:MAG: FAD-binding protein [Treponema sp.]|jgi:succinate dehydrogenase/fumarate reductase flavoprotein subunit|nr:FAD-binding protein [Treponema sp.]
MKTITVNGHSIRFFQFTTVIAGSGAAGLNAALQLHRLGHTDIAIVTEGLKTGTSLNTGSDKQTYYRLTLSGAEQDNIRRMAHSLFDGGSTDGDLALCEAALSARCFFNLVELGVPFPHNRYGEYIGYKTDHDPCMRGSSAGPHTSKFMTEALLGEVRRRAIQIYDTCQVIEVLTAPDGEGRKAAGILALDLSDIENPGGRYMLFSASNIVYAVGGEAGLYKTSVYPAAQTGGMGPALRSGIKAKNLTESQYGIASIKFRWNLSGTYQQVIPRYVSTGINGNNPVEFLDEYFSSKTKMLEAIFLKGYQWPFDPEKLENEGSSLIDLLVYNETAIKKRRVFLDFTRNPSCCDTQGGMDFSLIGDLAREYLENSGALRASPIERLAKMNPLAIDLYSSRHIDLRKEPLEIAVCAQHNNGGLSGNCWWESSVRHFFPVGEVNGSHGVYRPGGSALNAGQVGSLRASQYIAAHYNQLPPGQEDICRLAMGQIEEAVSLGAQWLAGRGKIVDPDEIRARLGERMSRRGAHIRSLEGAESARAEAGADLKDILNGRAAGGQLAKMYRARDLLVSQIVYLSAIADYIKKGGQSRGGYLIQTPDGKPPSGRLSGDFSFLPDTGEFKKLIQEITYTGEGCRIEWRDIRPIPDVEQWFETVWNDYRAGKVIE